MWIRRPLLTLLLLVFSGVCFASPALAAPPEPPAPTAKTTADPAIAPGDLKILLAPLPKAQLEVELEAWFLLVQQAAQTAADLELRLKAEERARKQDPNAPAVDDEADKNAHVDELSQVIADRTAAVDRFKQVMASFEKKGGEVEEYKRYLGAVTGVNVDAKDAGSTYKGLLAWARSEEGGRRWLGNLAKFFIVLAAFVVLAFAIGLGVRLVVRRTVANRSKLLATFIVSTTRRVIFIAGLLFAISTLEVDMTPILAVLGAAGFVVGFALQGTLGNLASGLMILAYRPFDVDDAVTVAGVTGKVSSMNLFSTTIKTFDNQVMIVPNNEVWNGVITNITGSERRRVDLIFGIGYGDDHDRARTILEGIVADHPLVLDDPAPVVRLHELADSSVNFVCRPWCRTDDYWDVYWDVTRLAKEAFDREGISIPFPQQDIHVISEAAVASAGAPS